MKSSKVIHGPLLALLFRSSCLLLPSLFLAESCKSTGQMGMKSELQSSADYPATEGCSGNESEREKESLSTSQWNGQKIYEMTERCVFNATPHTLKIRILSETYNKVLEEGCAGIDSGYGHVIALDIDGRSIENVGIKVRGNTSKCNQKRQFKFKFDSTTLFSKMGGKVESLKFPQNSGRNYFGLATLSIRASANDSTMIREKVASDGFAAVNALEPTTARGALVYRLAPTKVYVSFNRKAEEGPEGTFRNLFDSYYYDYKGFYSLAENLDHVFIQSRMQKANEALPPYHFTQADLALASFDRAQFNPLGWAPQFYAGQAVKTDEQKQKLQTEFFKLIELLEKNPTDAAIEQLVNVDSTLNYLTAALLSGHWDSLVSNANNDGMFFDGKKWQVVAWDLDNTLGANYNQFRKLMSNDLSQPATEHPNRLFTTILDPGRSFRARLETRMRKAMEGYFAQDSFNASMDRWSKLVRENSESWEGYNAQNYHDIKDFVAERRKTFGAQLQK